MCPRARVKPFAMAIPSLQSLRLTALPKLRKRGNCSPAGRPSIECDTDWTNRNGSPAVGSARAVQCTYHPLHWAELQNAQYVTSCPSLSNIDKLTLYQYLRLGAHFQRVRPFLRNQVRPLQILVNLYPFLHLHKNSAIMRGNW